MYYISLEIVTLNGIHGICDQEAIWSLYGYFEVKQGLNRGQI